MGPIVNLHQSADAHGGVFLSCGKTFMSQKFLYGPQVSSGVHHMGGKGMSEGMGTDLTIYPASCHDTINYPGHTSGG